MGQGVLPSFEYFVHKASKTLNCSFMELFDHPERLELMHLAFTLEQGINAGEYMMKCNPEYKLQVKAASKKMEIK